MNAAKVQTAMHDETPLVSSDTSLATLLGGIVSDVQKLFEDHLQLLRLEVEEDFEKSKQAMFPMVLGGSLLLAALLVSLAALVGWLTSLMPEIPWFGWSAIIAAATLILGGLLMILSQQRWQRVKTMPERTLLSVKKAIQRINQQVNTEPS